MNTPEPINRNAILSAVEEALRRDAPVVAKAEEEYSERLREYESLKRQYDVKTGQFLAEAGRLIDLPEGATVPTVWDLLVAEAELVRARLAEDAEKARKWLEQNGSD